MNNLETWEKIAVNVGLPLAYILLLVLVLTIVFFSIRNIITFRQQLRSSLIGIGVIGLLFTAGWLIALRKFTWGGLHKDLTPNQSIVLGAALNTMYFLLALAVLVILFFEVKKLFTK